MLELLLSFLISFAVTFLLVYFKHLHIDRSADFDFSAPQKNHKKIVPRIGGIGIVLGLTVAVFTDTFKDSSNPLLAYLIFSSLPVFFIGLLEDLTKSISIHSRLFWTIAGSVIFIFLFNVQIYKLDIPYLDTIFGLPFLGALFTIFAITGLTNAYNIIDGFNGLASLVGVLSLLGIAYISLIVGDVVVMYLSISMVGSIMGFFIWNYPKGLIFLGDGGAYFIGFVTATLSILVTCRNEEISPWFALLLNGYPTVESLFTIYRRKIHRGRNPGHPDGIHLHSLIFRRIFNSMNTTSELQLFDANSKTSPFLWALSLLTIIPAIIFYHSTLLLMMFFISFISLYIIIYKRLITFRTPSWIRPKKH